MTTPRRFHCIFCGCFCEGHRAGEFTGKKSWTGRFWGNVDSVCYNCCDCGGCELAALRSDYYAHA